MFSGEHKNIDMVIVRKYSKLLSFRGIGGPDRKEIFIYNMGKFWYKTCSQRPLKVSQKWILKYKEVTITFTYREDIVMVRGTSSSSEVCKISKIVIYILTKQREIYP